LIGDPELKIAKLYDMLPEAAGASSTGRTPADNQTVRTVFVIAPDKTIKALLSYPMTTGRNFDEVLRLLDSNPSSPARTQGGDAGELEAGRGRDHRGLGVRRGGEKDLPEGLARAEAYVRFVSAAPRERSALWRALSACGLARGGTCRKAGRTVTGRARQRHRLRRAGKPSPLFCPPQERVGIGRLAGPAARGSSRHRGRRRSRRAAGRACVSCSPPAAAAVIFAT